MQAIYKHTHTHTINNTSHKIFSNNQHNVFFYKTTNNFLQTNKLKFIDCTHSAQNHYGKCLGSNKFSYLFKIISTSRSKIILFQFNIHGVRLYTTNYFIQQLQTQKKAIQNKQYFVQKATLFIQ